jgi:AmiR/NasT family two-component response regulator
MRDQDNDRSSSDPDPAMMQVLQRLTEMTDRLERIILAVQNRDAIGQARGIFMERYGLSQDEALGLLITAARQGNHTSLKDVATTLILGRHLPLATDQHL